MKIKTEIHRQKQVMFLFRTAPAIAAVFLFVLLPFLYAQSEDFINASPVTEKTDTVAAKAEAQGAKAAAVTSAKPCIPIDRNMIVLAFAFAAAMKRGSTMP